MESSEYLYTVAEVAVALVGFAGIVIALRHRQSGLSGRDRSLVTDMVERGLAALFFALLPLLLVFLGLGSASVWPYCSGLLAAYITVAGVRSIRARFVARAPVRPAIFYGRFGASGVVILVQLANAFDVVLTSGVGWYLLGVTWLLVLSAFVFTLVLRESAA